MKKQKQITKPNEGRRKSSSHSLSSFDSQPHSSLLVCSLNQTNRTLIIFAPKSRCLLVVHSFQFGHCVYDGPSHLKNCSLCCLKSKRDEYVNVYHIFFMKGQAECYLWCAKKFLYLTAMWPGREARSGVPLSVNFSNRAAPTSRWILWWTSWPVDRPLLVDRPVRPMRWK